MTRQFKMKGTINNFMDRGNLIDDAWSVELNETGITPDTGAINPGTTTGGGMWNGLLYGDKLYAGDVGEGHSCRPGSPATSPPCSTTVT